MDHSETPDLSCYQTIAALNEAHQIFLVQHRDTHKIFVKKILDIYNIDIYQTLSAHTVYGIPRIVEYQETDGQLILIESYISGQSLEDLLCTTSLSLSAITRYILELCDILSRLHQMDPPIVHRDIKPSNLMITEHDHVILLDFNAAKHFSETSTSDTILLGTQGYAAPEQYGFGSSSPKTDIYAIGILFQELTAFLPKVPSPLSMVMEKCTKMDPSERYHTVDELKQEILNATGSPVAGSAAGKHSPSSSARWLPPGFRSRTLWKMLLAVPCYLILIWLSLTLQIEHANILDLWIQRGFCLLISFSLILGTFNYRDIHTYFPWCKSRHPLLKLLGIVLLDLMLAFPLMIAMALLSSLF